jgi:hypothetical protein
LKKEKGLNGSNLKGKVTVVMGFDHDANEAAGGRQTMMPAVITMKSAASVGSYQQQ